MAEPEVDAVIVSYETRDLTLRAVASVLASTGVRPTVWVVDNGSSDGTAEAVERRFSGVRVLALARNVGFGRGNNAALERGSAPYALLLNSDATLPDAGGLRALVDALDARPRAGAIGPRLVDARGRIEYSARALPSVAGELARAAGLHHLLPAGARERLLGLEFFDHDRSGPAGWLTGACLLLRRAALDEVGGFDPRIFLYGEELDWCWRLRRAGWEVRYEAGVRVRHLRRASPVAGRAVTAAGAEVPGIEVSGIEVDGIEVGGAEADGTESHGTESHGTESHGTESHGTESHGTEAWRVRASLAGEAYAVRKHRGRAYLAAFAAARSVSLAGEVALQGALGVMGGGGERRRRARAARTVLAAWLHALARGGARDPGAVAFRPPGSEGGR